MSGRARTLSRGRSQALDISQPVAPGAAADIPRLCDPPPGRPWVERVITLPMPPHNGESHGNWESSHHSREPSNSHPEAGHHSCEPSNGHPEAGHRSQEPRYGHPEAGHHSRKPRYGHPEAGHRSREPRYVHPEAGHRSREPSYGHPEAGHRSREPSYGHPGPGHRSREPSYGHPGPGHRSREPSYGHPGPGHRSRESSYGHPGPGHRSRESSYGHPGPGHRSRESSYGHPEPGHHRLVPGTGGEVIKLQTNHYPVTCGHEIAYKYNIDYQPDIKDMAIRTDLLLRHKSILGNCHIFDGNSLLLPRRLQHLEMELVSQTESDGKVRIRIRLSSELHPNHPEWLRYYNILFSKLLKLNNIEEMDSNPRDLRDLRNLLQASRMDIKRSYTTSILPYEKSLTLCADVTHRLLQKKTVWDLIAEKNDSVTKEEEVFEEVVGSIVYTSYNNKTYRIDDVKWEKKPKDTFDKFDGSKTTYIDYYMKRYNTSITELGQPLLMSLGKWKKGQTSTPHEPIFLVPQLCYLTGVPRAVSENHSLMAQLTDRMRMSPVNRRIALNNFMNDIQTNQNIKNEFLQWKVTFDGNSLSVPGRVLSSVKLFQGARSYTVKPHLQNWLRDSKNIALHRAKSLDRWVILHTRSCSSQANRLVSTLEKVTEKMNIKMSRAARHQVNEDPGSFRQALQKHISKDTQMVVCVLPDNRKQRYEEIKTFLCVENPVPSQCVVASTLNNERNLTTIVTKIAQQMNCKMGGALWKVDTRMEKTMFIGIDCFHDIVSRQKSVAAFVASTKEDLTMWYSQCLFQDTAEEIVNDLQSCLQGALNSWVANEKQKPQSVVVYRDGVGDGQLQALLEKEVRQFQKFFTSSIKLTFIVVKKRINTRFFVENGDEVTNPPSGTVVDQIVTRKEWYDFYIVSQTSNSGTVTPTHYNVIYDTKGLTPNQVQCLTYRLCHMYYNLPGIIRVPAPCHYAHRLAYFVGKSIHQKPASSLSDYLYYL
ncbi:piwi-like protein 3 [Chionomys nivalis]|uniref:piwi-like protein 3 n=1 Tax=Chionomys nivalis TaxID=269649 RepID=UPI00259376AC|nr:piwi-like protein 3 [Chionomys nivalis]